MYTEEKGNLIVEVVIVVAVNIRQLLTLSNMLYPNAFSYDTK